MATPLRSEIHQPFTLDTATLLSLGLAFTLMPAAQLAANYFLPRAVSTRYKYIFIWLFYDFLTHTIIEGSYLYHCFFSYVQLPTPGTTDYPHPASLSAHTPHFLGHRDRKYGALYSTAPMAKLWQEYSKADARWAGSDLVIISIEFLTVGIAGPVALYCCYLISRVTNATNVKGDTTLVREKAGLEARLWILLITLSTGELYGGWMTFCPEWLSESANLAGLDEPVYWGLYLLFFNGIWVVIPAWILWEAWKEMRDIWTGHALVVQALRNR